MSAPEVALQLDAVSKSFGTLPVVKSATFGIQAGRITALVGSNGAGKTTMFNMISGVFEPTSGTVAYRGQTLNGLSAQARSRLGIGRTFQELRLFTGLSAVENVLVAGRNQPGESFRNLLLRPRVSRRAEKANRVRAYDALSYVGLQDGRGGKLIGDLSYGEQKLVSLARLLAMDAQLLLLDEPASGLDEPSVEQLKAIVQQLAEEGRTILMVEHNMVLVRDLCDWSVFLANGEILAEGTPKALMSDPAVRERYLGAVVPDVPTTKG